MPSVPERVIAPALPGFGRSEELTGEVTGETLARSVTRGRTRDAARTTTG